MKKLLFLLLFFVNSFILAKAKALDLDEKLTVRILETSGSKKTILINRGHEDGVVVDTHAKFFLSTGVFARGVARKVSPARSIWSIYRIVKPEHIVANKVANMKVSTAIKLTEDPSQAIVVQNRKYEMGEPKDLSQDNNLTDENLSMNESSELSSLLNDEEIGSSNAPMMTRKLYKKGSHNIELASLLSFSSLSGTDTRGATSSASASTTDTEQSSYDLTLSAEKLFPGSNGFLRHFGIRGLLELEKDSSGASTVSETSNFNLGFGVSYYFQDPFYIGQMTYYIDGAIGRISSTVTTTDSTNSANDTKAEGSGSFYSFGAGLKYLANKNFGFTGKVEYVSSTVSFDYEESDGSIRTDEKNLSGPQVQFGLFLRFF